MLEKKLYYIKMVSRQCKYKNFHLPLRQSCRYCKNLGYQYSTLLEFATLNNKHDLLIDYSLMRFIKYKFPVEGVFYMHVIVPNYKTDPQLCSLCGGTKVLFISSLSTSTSHNKEPYKHYYSFEQTIRCFYCDGSGTSDAAILRYFAESATP